MNLDDRIQQAVNAVIQQARTLVETELRALADHAVASSAEEREAAVAEAASAKAAEIEEAVRRAKEAAQAEHEAALDEVQAAAERDRELAVQQARLSAETEAADRLAAAQAEADQALATAKAEAEQALAAGKAEAEQTIAAIRAEADQAVAAVAAEADEAVATAKAESGRALAAAKEEFDQALAVAKAEFDQVLARATAESDQARAAAADGEQKFAEAEAEAASRLAAAEREIAELEEAVAAARVLAEQRAVGKVSEAVTEARADERQADLACAARLLEVTKRFDRASSLTEILDGLADYAHAEVGRAALFLIQGPRLHGWRVLGFESVPENGHGVELDLNAAGVITRAVRTGEPAATSDPVGPGREQGAREPLPPFLALTVGRAGLAMPVSVGHQVVAVLYTDEGTGAPRCTPSAWPEIVEVATRHAARCLELLTASKVASARSGSIAETGAPHRAGKMPADSGTPRAGSGHAGRPLAEEVEEGARRYARLLVSEIKLYNEGAVAEGKQARNVLTRLQPEIDRARRLYEEKYPMAVGGRVNWFDEELVRTLADGNASLLGNVT